MDKIYIDSLEIIGFHGVFPEEKKLGQKFIISITMDIDTRVAGKNGGLENTVHYGEVAQDVEKIFLEKSFDLLEMCAERIAELILRKYRLIKKIKVKIEKPCAPLQLHFKNVAVEIERAWHTLYLSLGTNMGDKTKNLKNAIDYINIIENTFVLKTSEFIETKPFGYLEQDNFLNTCLEVMTLLTPQEFLKNILEIELKMGRVRKIKWGPRIIDIDILFYDKEIIEEDNLAIPHPYVCEREFVLIPLSEIAPNFIHPLENKTIKVLNEKLKKPL